MRKLLILLVSAASFLAVSAQDYCSMVRTAPLVSGSVSPGYSQLECLYDVGFYFIDVEANDSTADISATTTIDFRALAAIDTLAFELSNSQVVSQVTLNGANIPDFIQANGLLMIMPEESIREGTSNRVAISYAGTTSTQGFFTGLANGYDYVYNKRVTYTLSEPYESSDWFPVKQDLSDKADSVWVFITTREGLMGGSNGLLTRVAHPEPGKVRYEWKSRYPIDFYLISFTVADYIDYSFYAVSDVLGDSLLVQNFIYDVPGILENQKENIDWTGSFIIYFSELFGRYPFIREKYGHCMAPIGGGMEHQTMTTLQNFNFSLVSHELTHQWFGDYVTCGSWRDIWLNEGFASYGEYLALDKFKGRTAALNWMADAHERALMNPEMSVHLTESEARDPMRIFNYNTTYKKGASIINTLRYEIDNDSLFFGILRHYLQQHADSTAVATDFIHTVNELTGKDFNWFFDQWYYGAGYPTLETSWNQYEDSVVLNVYQVQVNNEVKIYKMHMDFKLVFEDGSDSTFRVWLDKLHEHFALPAEKKITTIVVDPELKVLMKSSVYENTQSADYMEVSPNPFTSDLDVFFKSPEQGRKMFVAGTNGDIFYSQPAEGVTSHLNLQALEQGIFLLFVITADGRRYAKKVIKLNRN